MSDANDLIDRHRTAFERAYGAAPPYTIIYSRGWYTFTYSTFHRVNRRRAHLEEMVERLEQYVETRARQSLEAVK